MIENIGPMIYKGESIYNTGAGGGKPVPFDSDFSLLLNGSQNSFLKINSELFNGIFAPLSENQGSGILFSDNIDLSNYNEFEFICKCKYISKKNVGYNDKYILNRFPTSGRLFAFAWDYSTSRFKVGYLGITQNDFLDFVYLPASFNLDTQKELKFIYNKLNGQFKFYCENILTIDVNIGVREVTTWRIDFGTETLSNYAYLFNGDEIDLSKTSLIADGIRLI